MTKLGEAEVDVSWSAQMDMGGFTRLNEKKLFQDKSHEDAINYGFDKLGDDHPKYDWLKLESANMTPWGDEGTMVDLVWVGVPKGSEVATYSCNVSLSQEPIDTHPKFEKFAGSPQDMDMGLGYVPDTGAVFSSDDEETAVFEKFAMKEGDDGTEDNSLAGVSSYLVPSIIWKESRQLGTGFSSSEAADVVEDLGMRYTKVPRKIQDADGSSVDLRDIADTYEGDRDWLMVSAQYEVVGAGGKLDREWRMSGEMGWNDLIYKKGSDSVGQVSRNSNDYGDGSDPFPNDVFKGNIQGEEMKYDELPQSWTYSYDKSNKVTAKGTWKVKAGEGLQIGKDFMIGANRHPTFPYLSAVGASITNDGSGFDSINVDFAGVGKDGEWEGSFSVATTTEPIDTHPNFASGYDGDGKTIGGTAEEPANGAIFADNGAFEKFSAFIAKDNAEDQNNDRFPDGVGGGDKVPNQMAGVTSYLEVGMDWTETKYFTKLADGLKELENAGKIMKPQSKNPYPPRVKGADGDIKDWLNMGGTWEQVAIDSGSGCKVTITFRLSGGRQWNDDIYEK